jgi:drug/metabolite transporter (DMT)-like permease
VSHKNFVVSHLLTIALVMIPLLLFFWKMSPEALFLKNLGILALVVFFAVLANKFAYYALEWEKVSELEPIKLMQPFFIILFAFVIYSAERQIKIGVLIAATIAALALIFSHIKKHHFRFNKYLVAGMLGSLFFALELVISRSILEYYNPLTFYFVRSSFVAIFAWTVLKPDLSKIPKKSWWHIIIIGCIWVVYRVLIYFGYTTYGVIFTTLLFILAPVFVYILASIYLKEKLTWRNIIATIIIVAAVAYAITIS